MNKLNYLKDIGFRISWKLISIGLLGKDEIPVLLTYDDVLEYLDSLLMDVNDQTNNIIRLICTKDDCVQFADILTRLANEDHSDPDIQKRKWRVYLVNNIIEHKNGDYMQGLLELMEFWISMGMPDDCPQIFPSSGRKEIVEDYFTQASYDLNLNKNREWLNREIQNIIMHEE